MRLSPMTLLPRFQARLDDVHTAAYPRRLLGLGLEHPQDGTQAFSRFRGNRLVWVVNLLDFDGGGSIDAVRYEIRLLLEAKCLAIGAEKVIDEDGLADADIAGAHGEVVMAELGVGGPGKEGTKEQDQKTVVQDAEACGQLSCLGSDTFVAILGLT